MRFRTALRALVLAMILAVGTSAMAVSDVDRDRAEKLADIGYDHYDANDFVAASEAFAGAYRIHKIDKYVLNQAKCMQKLGKPIEALQLFETGIRNHPRSGLAGKVRGLVSKLRRELGATMTEVKFSSAPPGAKVFLDGAEREIGRTPHATWLSFGPHSIRLTFPEHEPSNRAFQIVAGDPLAVQVTLAKRAVPGTLTFGAVPPGADIFINGKIRGVTPMRGGMELKPGTYDVLLRLPGHGPYTTTIELGDGSSVAIEPTWSDTGPATAPVLPVVDVPRAPGGGLHWGSWTGAGLGAGGFIASGLFIKQALDSAAAAQGVSKTSDSPGDREAWEDHKAGAQDSMNMAVLGFGVGAAGFATAILIEAFRGGPLESSGDTGVVQLAPGLTPGGVSILGRF
jgi:hypothetical protein